MEATDFTESFFINPDGIKLYRQIYQPINPPIKAFVFVCHGLFEHCQSSYYDTIISPLRNIGCLILTHDNCGHGRSEGNRGVISSVDNLVRDVLLDIADITNELQLDKTVPVFLYGHSLGGLIAVHASLQKKNYFKGLILEAPALLIGFNKATVRFIRFVNRMYPACPLRKANYSHISRNVAHNKEIKADKLQIHDALSAKSAVAIADSIEQCVAHLTEADTPVLVFHGSADKLTIPKGSEMFMKTIVSTDKTLVTFPGARHRLRMEIDNVSIELTKKTVAWLNERIN